MLINEMVRNDTAPDRLTFKMLDSALKMCKEAISHTYLDATQGAWQV